MNLSKQLQTTSLIHLHTDVGSVGDGAGKISDYMSKFKNNGVEYATLTDHGDISGLLQFYKAAKKNGINPGLGCEFYLNDRRDSDLIPKKKRAHAHSHNHTDESVEQNNTDDADADDDNPDDFRNNHIIVCAKNDEGLKRIIKINNEAVLNGYYRKPRTTTEKIFEFAGDGNILVSSGCLAGFPARMIMSDKISELESRLSEWKERFKDDFYLELQFNELEDQHVVNRELVKLSKKLKIKTIIAQDCHYVDEGEHFLQLLKMLGRNRKQLKDLDDGIPKGMWIFEATELFVKSNIGVVETAKKFNYDIPQNIIIDSLINNQEWHHKTKMNWDLSIKHYNKYVPPEPFKTSDEYFEHILKIKLKEFVEKGYIDRDRLREYAARVVYEKKTLIEKGYVDYLLETMRAIQQVINAVGGNEAHIGIGRGSAAGCLCAYLLGIHKIDPIKHELIFERFLSEARSNEMIDIDF